MHSNDHFFHIVTLVQAGLHHCRTLIDHTYTNFEHALQLTATSSVLMWSQHGMLLQKKLPTEFFEKQNIWLYRGNMYRLLVEPCDIANHYGLKSMSGVGHYLAGNRPGR